MNYNNTTHTNMYMINTSDDTVWVAQEFDVSVSNIALAVTLIILDVVTIVGNLLVLLSFVIEKRLLQSFNIFILNLAVTDFLIAITAMPFYTLDTLLGYWPFGTIMCGVWIYFDFAMTFASVFTLVAISVDRFWCVTWAIHYKLHKSKRNTTTVVAIIWLVIIVMWTPPFIVDRLHNSEPNFCIWEPSDNTEFVIFVAVIGHYVPCIIMVFCYIKVFMVMRHQANIVGASSTGNSSMSTVPIHVQQVRSDARSSNVDTDQPHVSELDDCHSNPGQYLSTVSGQYSTQNASPYMPSSSQTHLQTAQPRSNRSSRRSKYNSNNQTREKRIFVTLTYVLCSYVILWVPFYVTFDTYAWKPDLVPAGLYSFFFWSTYVNSTLNPIIYAYTNKDFRSAFIKVLKTIFMCSQ